MLYYCAMNRKALVLSCLLLSAAAASAQDSSSVLEVCDKRILEAEFAVNEIERCAATLPKVEAAGRKAPVEESPKNRVTSATSTIITTVPPSPLSSALAMEANADPGHTRLVDYYAFSAFVKKDPKACAPLAKVPESRMEAECLKEAAGLGLDVSWSRPDQDFVNACLAQGGALKVGKECCGLVARSRARPNCAALTKCFSSENYCRQFFAARSGDAAACERLTPQDMDCGAPAACAAERSRCKDWAAYAAASRAKDAGRCGDSDRCRVLMGVGGRVLAERAAELEKGDLGRWFLGRGWERPHRKETVIKNPVPVPPQGRGTNVAPPASVATRLPGFVCQAPLHRPENRKLIDDVSAAAHACLDRVDAVVSPVDVKMAQAVDSRREKSARLTVRARALLDPAAGARPPSGANKR